MVKSISAKADADFIRIKWSAPKFLPDSYQVDVTCRLMPNETEYILVNLNARPFATMLTIDKLFPGSLCVFTLLAIYNPASIDDGITRNIATLNSSMYT